MANEARYVFPKCQPADEFTFMAVTPGEILERTFSFRVNGKPILQSTLGYQEVDPRNILHGADGKLIDENGNTLATVQNWSASASVTTADVQLVNDMHIKGITTGYSVTLEFTEVVVHDEMLVKVFNGLTTGRSMPDITFVAVADSTSINQ